MLKNIGRGNSLMILAFLFFSSHASLQAQRAQPIGHSPSKTNSVNPIPMGHGRQHYNSGFPHLNLIAADDSTGAVIFIHDPDPNLSGYNLFEHQYDISTDKGATWSVDVGILNTSDGFERTPQIALYSPPGNTNPLVGNVVFMGDLLDVGGYRGFEYGVNILTTAGPLPIMQDTVERPSNWHVVQGAFVQGKKGEYWTARYSNNGAAMSDSLLIYKATMDPVNQKLNWALHTLIIMPWELIVGGQPHAIQPTVAFSPDGSIGWVALVGDLLGGQTRVYSPVVIKSTDGGNTWGNPQEIDLNSFGWVRDSLQAHWFDTLGNPFSTGVATTGYEYDATVDANGNLHMFFTLGSSRSTGHTNSFYWLQPKLTKYGVDLMSVNQGAAWDLRIVAPFSAYRGFLGSPTGFQQANYPQISRTHSGSHIFYSWLDSDSSVIEYGNNSLPNLFIAGYRVSDGYFTCLKSITAGDSVWDGKVYSAQMAPEVLRDNGVGRTSFHLPIVSNKWTNNSQYQPVLYHYFGADAVITESEFVFPPGSLVSWTNCTIIVEVDGPAQSQVLIYPHPMGDQTRIEWQGWTGESWIFELYDLQGRKLCGREVNSATLDFQRGNLAAGAYVYRISGNGLNLISGKLILE